MISHYLRLAFRALLRKKLLFGINVGGLGVGLASCLFIIWFVIDELTYDRHYPNADRIFRVTMSFADAANTSRIRFTDQKIGPYLKRTQHQVEEFVRFDGFPADVAFNGELIREEEIFRADPSAFDVFGFDLVAGDKNTALSKKNSIVLSETLATKYFGGAALGGDLTINKETFEVTGVMKDMPSNSDKMIRGMVSADFPDEESDQLAVAFDTYVLFRSPHDVAEAQAIVDSAAAKMTGGTSGVAYEVQALKDLHFTQGIQFDNPKGSKTNVYIFLTVAAILMLVVIFNFVNLTTVQSLDRAREVGVRKVNGATPGQLTRQFTGESLPVAGLAGCIALLLLEVFHSLFHAITGKKIEFTSTSDILIIGGSIAVLLAVTLLSAFYPASILSRLRPVQVLRGSLKHQPQGNMVRKLLIVTQFALTSFLVVFLGVVIAQTNLLNSSDPGFNKDDVIISNIPGGNPVTAREEIAKWPGVDAVTVAQLGSVPGQEVFASPVWIEQFGEEREINVQQVSADARYFDVFQLKISAGEAPKDIASGKTDNIVLVNEAFARIAGWPDPVGKEVQLFSWEGRKKATITGVIKDFHFRSLHNTIDPLVYTQSTDGSNLCLRLQPGQTSPGRLDEIRTHWKKTWPDARFDYYFLGESFDGQYKAENLLLILLFSFSALTVFLAGLGLFGLTSYNVETRTKEIGIRKVLGANTYSIITRFSKEFIGLVLAGTLLGSFASVFLCRSWLDTFAYRIELAFWLPLLPALLTITFAVVITAYRIYFAARLNPVKTLRYE